MNRFVPSFPDDLLSHPPGLLAGCGFDLVPLRSFQKAIRFGREGRRLSPRGIVGLVSEEQETDIARVVPAIQMPGLGKLGVSSQQDLVEASLAAKCDRLVQVDVGKFLRGSGCRCVQQGNSGSPVLAEDQERMEAYWRLE